MRTRNRQNSQRDIRENFINRQARLEKDQGFVGKGQLKRKLEDREKTGQWRLESGYIKQNEGQGERIK